MTDETNLPPVGSQMKKCFRENFEVRVADLYTKRFTHAKFFSLPIVILPKHPESARRGPRRLRESARAPRPVKRHNVPDRQPRYGSAFPHPSPCSTEFIFAVGRAAFRGAVRRRWATPCRPRRICDRSGMAAHLPIHPARELRRQLRERPVRPIGEPRECIGFSRITGAIAAAPAGTNFLCFARCSGLGACKSEQNAGARAA